MPITPTDIKTRLSTRTGTAGNTNPSTPAASLGKFISTTDWIPATNGLFDDVSGDENANLVVDYRCIFVLNTHGTLTYQNAVTWFDIQVVSGSTVSMAVDSIGVVNVGALIPQASSLANELAAPTVTGSFVSPAIKANAVALGSIGPGQCVGLWLKRTSTNSPATNNDGFDITFSGDTAA